MIPPACLPMDCVRGVTRWLLGPVLRHLKAMGHDLHLAWRLTRRPPVPFVEDE